MFFSIEHGMSDFAKKNRRSGNLDNNCELLYNLLILSTFWTSEIAWSNLSSVLNADAYMRTSDGV